jgi:EmrB/QacA subfamily drug resistance transporter
MKLTEPEVRATIIGALTTMFLAALEQTIVATALPTIAAELGDVHLLSWVVTAYLLTSTIATPIAGKMGDLYGRRRVLQVSMALFLAGSVLCALAPSMEMLIFARALQGVGGGGLITSSQAAVGDVVSPRERGRYSAYFSIVWGSSSLLGPSVGGLLTQHVGWPWIFWINLPLGIVAIVIADRALKRIPIQGRKGSLDVVSLTFLALGTFALLTALSLGGTRFPWASPQILAGLAVAAGLLYCFARRQTRIPEPILPPRFLGDSVIGPVLAGLFLAFGSYLAIAVLVPTYLQIGHQIPAATVGLLMMPLMLSSTFTAWAAGRYTKTHGRYKLPPLIGLPIAIVSLLALAYVADTVGPVTATLLLTLFGFGIGPIFPVTMVAAQNAVQRRDIGAVVGAIGFSRALGGAVILALASALALSLIVAWVPDTGALSSLEDLVRHPLPPDARAEVTRAFGVMFAAVAAVLAVSLAIFSRVEARPLRESMD